MTSGMLTDWMMLIIAINSLITASSFLLSKMLNDNRKAKIWGYICASTGVFFIFIIIFRFIAEAILRISQHG